MSTTKFEAGDWVFAAKQIVEETASGRVVIHASPHAIGHVMDYAGDGFYTVTWERTLTTTDCHADDLQFMCGPYVGRLPVA